MLGKIRNGNGGGALKKAVADLLTSLGVTTKASAKDAVVLDNINTLSDNKYESGYSTGQAAGYASGITDGANSVTLTSTASGRTVTTTASNGTSSSLSIAYGTSSGNHTYILTPTGNNIATVTFAAGYYKAGTITADGSQSYSAGVENGYTTGQNSYIFEMTKLAQASSSSYTVPVTGQYCIVAGGASDGDTASGSNTGFITSATVTRGDETITLEKSSNVNGYCGSEGWFQLNKGEVIKMLMRHVYKNSSGTASGAWHGNFFILYYYDENDNDLDSEESEETTES